MPSVFFNQRRATLREFSQIAALHPNLVTPQRRNTVIKSGYLMDVVEHTKAVEAIVTQCKTLSPEPWKRHKIVVTGIIADSPLLFYKFWLITKWRLWRMEVSA